MSNGDFDVASPLPVRVGVPPAPFRKRDGFLSLPYLLAAYPNDRMPWWLPTGMPGPDGRA